MAENNRYKVLVIEDDKIAQTAFERLVRNENLPYDYTIAGSISEAGSILDSQEFDVVIADYLLGDGTAFDILGLVRETPVIFATGAGNEELAVKAMKAGAYDYLIKNPARNYLVVLPLIIENAISHVRMEQEVKKYHQNLEELVKERTEQLQAEKELFSVTLSSMTDGVIVVNADKQIMLINDVTETLTGAKLEDTKGKVVDDILRLVDERSRNPVESPIDKVLTSGNVQSRTEPSILVAADGDEHLISAAAAPIRKHRGTVSGVVMLLHDMSQEREIDRMKTDFVSFVSHELRTPLTSIKAYTATILRDPNMHEQTKCEFLTAVDEESNRLTDLVNELLEISQLESGDVELIRRDVDIAAVVDQALSSLKQLAEDKNIQIEADAGDAPGQVLGDEIRIRSMVSNLVNNAIKFTPEGGKVRVRVQHQDGELAISVSDTGIGMAKEEIPKIFDRFYRVHQPGKQIPGTGLGLAVVNETASIHGGKVEVESELNKGTTFTVFLPLTGRAVLEVTEAKHAP